LEPECRTQTIFLNWFVCPKCGSTNTLHIAEALKDDAANLPENAFIMGEDYEVSFLDKLPSVCLEPECRTQTIFPFIVPPTWSKGEHHRQIREVWRNAANMLKDAENIIVMGYSWPESDQFFHSLFALGTVSPTFLRRFWICDPDEKVPDRFRRLLGPQAADPDVFGAETKPFGEATTLLPEFLSGRRPISKPRWAQNRSV